MKLHKEGTVIFENKLYDFNKIRSQMNIVQEVLKYVEFEHNKPLALALPRSPWLISTIFTLLEMKIPFMPIDTTQPMERIDYMLENAEVEYIITSHEVKLNFQNKKILYINSEIAEKVESKATVHNNEIAYILYTSGTTGKPKAIEVRRKGLSNLIDAIPEIINFSVNKIIACFTNCTFDMFFLESILALCKGLTVVLANEDEQNNPKKMTELIVTHDIQMLQMTPSRMKLLNIYDKKLKCLKNVEVIMIGGEIFPESLLKTLQEKKNVKIFNMYGPTETTIWSTVSELTHKKKVDIGHPIKNTEIFILDSNLIHCQEGEICIAGNGLARGYKNNDEQTKKAFTYLQDNEEVRIYRTGDLGKYDEDGNLICLGRIDNQVKLRGYRIELDEIDNNLADMDEITLSVTCHYQNDVNSELITFYMSECNVSFKSFNDYLTGKLPEYMIPQKYIKVMDFEYTSSGKIDRNAILSNNIKLIHNGENITDIVKVREISSENNSSISKEVFEVIRNVLENQIVNLTEETSLMELGINSLNFISIIVELEDKFDIEFEDDMLTIKAFENIKQIVQYIEK